MQFARLPEAGVPRIGAVNVGLVSVLFVSVSVVSLPTSVSEALGSMMVLLAVGSVTVRVVL